MIQIATKDLSDYFKRAAGIPHAGVMPVLSYIKIETKGNEAVITETNGNSIWLQHTVNAESTADMTVLVLKETLKAVVNKSSSPAIQIRPRDKKIEISDLSFKLTCPTEDVELFPLMPERDTSNRVLLSEELLDAIAVAKHAVFADDKYTGMNSFEVVHVTPAKEGSNVFASDRHMMYSNVVPGDKAEFMLDKGACDMLAHFKECHFDTAGNHYFFDGGRTLLGFTKYEYKRFDHKPFITGYQEEIFFTVERRKIIDFCERIEALPLKVIYNEIELRDGGENTVQLIFTNSEYENDGNEDVTVVKQGVIKPLFFNAELMLKLLAPLPYDEIKLLPFDAKGQQWVARSEDDKDYTGMIFGLTKQ